MYLLQPPEDVPSRLRPRVKVRIAVLAALLIAALLMILLRLWSLQVLSGDHYLNASQNNELRLIRVEAPRGPILDRRGRIVVIVLL